MIDLALSLIDYLLKFLEKREGSMDEFYERYIHPAYEAAELVFSDYLNLLHIVREKIAQNNPLDEIIKYLEDGRTKYLPVRMRLRSEIFRRSFRRPYFDNDMMLFADKAIFDRLPLFERGILGILMGGIIPLENIEYYPHTPYLRGQHTLLSLLYRFSEYSSEGSAKKEYLEAVDNQIEALKLAWQDVVNGYAEYKIRVAPTPWKMKPYRYKREGD